MSRILAVLAAAAMLLAALPVVSAIADTPCPPLAAEDVPTFSMDFVDISRAGGEPMIEVLNDGTLLWGSHAGTTHFYAPASVNTNTGAFIENYHGQTYQYYSTDGGVTWEFVPRLANPTTVIGGTPASGFSDPVFAVDEAGTVYISEINLANVAVSASTDGGRNYELRSIAAFTSSDRQWMAADEPGVLYMAANGVGAMTTVPSTSPGFQAGGHVLAKSTDGGLTWGAPEKPNPNGVGENELYRPTGDLYEITATSAGSNATLSMGVFRGIRDADSNFAETLEHYEIVAGAGYTAIGRQIDPTLELDRDGNVYVVWAENGRGTAEREAGIYYSYSPAYVDGVGLQFTDPVRVDGTDETSIWPWIAVGAPGEVAITYLENEQALANYDAESAGPEDGWNVMTAVTVNGLGCDGSDNPGFTVVQASSEPVHYGTVCQGGTLCQAQAIDRRMGDYFSNVIDTEGNQVIAVSDTTQGGGVSLPRVIRQTGGVQFTATTDNPAPAEGAVAGSTSANTLSLN